MGLALEGRFGKGQKVELAEAAARHEGLVPVAWDHRGFDRIAEALTGGAATVPRNWSKQCFDRFWIFTRRDAG